MPSTKSDFSIENASPLVKKGLYSGRIILQSSDEVREIALIAGIEPSRFGDILKLRIQLDEEDPAYHRILGVLSDRYDISPTVSGGIPQSLREKMFYPGLHTTWSESEINAAPFGRLIVQTVIAKHSDGNDEQIETEVLTYTDASRTAEIGLLSPFHGMGVSEDMLKRLNKEGLVGLRGTLGVDMTGKNKRVIYALRSSIIMPPALNPVINEAGEVVAPNTQWWSSHEDGGRSPLVLRFRASEVKAISPFDIAMTYERVGYRRAAAYRLIIVSQRFRQVLKKLKIRAVNYHPVILE